MAAVSDSADGGWAGSKLDTATTVACQGMYIQ